MRTLSGFIWHKAGRSDNSYKHCNDPLALKNAGNFSTTWRTIKLSRRTLFHKGS